MRPLSRCSGIAALTVLLVSRSSLAADPPAPSTSSSAPTPPAPAASPSLVPPRLIEEAAAEYPPQALKDRREAIVLLDLEIDASGTVTQATVVREGDAEFDAAAIDAARRFRFDPARREGRAIASKIRYSYAFKLAPQTEPVAPAHPRPQAESKGALRGRIVDGSANAPVAGAHVQVRHTAATTGATPAIEGSLVADLVSNDDGSWSFADLAPGTYTVRIEAPGYEIVTFDERVVAGVASEIATRINSVKPLEIEVRGKRPNNEVTHHAIAREDIRTSPGSRSDPLLAVQNLPGMARSPGPPNGGLVVRGSSPTGTLVFIDGAWAPLAFHFGGLSSVIPSELVEQIDYFPGNLRARYGRGTGGVIEIKTRALRYDQKLHGVLQVDLLDGRVLAEAPIPGTNSWSFVVGARRSWLDAWIGPVLRDAGSNVSTAPYYYDYQAFAETRPSSTSRFRIGVYGGADAFASVTDKIVESDPAVSGRNNVGYGYYRVQINHEAEPAKGVRTSWLLSVGSNTEKAQFGRVDIRDTINVLTSRADLSLDLAPALTLHGGLDVLAAKGTLDLHFPNLPDAGDNAIRTFSSGRWETYRKDETFLRPAGYVEIETRPIKTVTVIAGLRLDHTREISDTTIGPRLSVAWEVHPSRPKTTIRAGAGVYFQPPDPIDILRDTQNQLRSQRAQQVSLGLDQEIGRHLTLSSEAYAKSLDKLSLPVASPDGGTELKNVGTGSVVGAEAMLRTRGLDRFTGWISYSLSRSVRRDGAGQPTRIFQYDQTHVLTALGTFTIGRGWQIGARFRYTSGMPFTPCKGGMIDGSTGGYACVPGAPLSDRLPAFHQLDVRIEKGWQFSTWRLSAYLDAMNVYNHKNPEGVAYSYDQSKREYQSGLPFLPILGVRGEL